MKKKLALLFAVIFVIGFIMGCGGGKGDVSVASAPAAAPQTTEKETEIDMELLDATMAIVDALLKDKFGSNYSLFYDRGGVTISLWKEGAAQAASLAKIGNGEAAGLWGDMVDALQSLSGNLHEILVKSGLDGIPVAVRFFDTENKSSALVIAVDGEITYDASK